MTPTALTPKDKVEELIFLFNGIIYTAQNPYPQIRSCALEAAKMVQLATYYTDAVDFWDEVVLLIEKLTIEGVSKILN